MLRGGAGMIRFCLDPKNMSLQSTTFPPLTAAARSTSPRWRSAFQSGVTSPYTRNAAECGSLHSRLPRRTLEIVVRRRSRHDANVYAARLGIIALEMRRLDVD